MVKFIYSEKATKFCEIFPLLLTTVHTVKCKGKILQNFVAFSEYMKFKTGRLSIFQLSWCSNQSVNLVYTQIFGGFGTTRSDILSSWHPSRVLVIFIQILKRNNPKERAISSQSTAQSHIITVTLALESRARNCSKNRFITFQALYMDQRRV